MQESNSAAEKSNDATKCITIVPNRGKTCDLYWTYTQERLCGLNIRDARNLIGDLVEWIKETEKKWVRQK